MEKNVILGIDFSEDYTQIAYLSQEGTVHPIPIGASDNYIIPTVVLYDDDTKEWCVGESALNRQLVNDKAKLCDRLPSKTDDENAIEVYKAFFAGILDYASNSSGELMIRFVSVSVENLTPEISNLIIEVLTGFGFDENEIKICSHDESFGCYVLSQNREIWINEVLMVRYGRYESSVRSLSVTRGKKPDIVYVHKTDIADRLSCTLLGDENTSLEDQALAGILSEITEKSMVSGIYLTGEGILSGKWDMTIKAVSRNRRIFMGNNLIVIGAVLFAREFFGTPHFDNYLIACKGRTKLRIFLRARDINAETKIIMAEAGEYWAQSGNSVECIMRGNDPIEFDIVDVSSRTTKTVALSLDDFPNRTDGTVRISIGVFYENENTVKFEIKDLGFGEFFESSGANVLETLEVE